MAGLKSKPRVLALKSGLSTDVAQFAQTRDSGRGGLKTLLFTMSSPPTVFLIFSLAIIFSGLLLLLIRSSDSLITLDSHIHWTQITVKRKLGINVFL